MRVKHSEFLMKVSAGRASAVVSKVFKMGSTGLTMLDSLSQVYSRFVLHSVKVEYRPQVGTSKDGLTVVAVDWNPTDTPPDDAKLRVMQPQIRGPVWQPGEMTLPAMQLQAKRNLLTGDQVFAFQIGGIVGTGDMGEIIVTYDVSMMGPSGN